MAEGEIIKREPESGNEYRGHGLSIINERSKLIAAHKPRCETTNINPHSVFRA